MYVCLGGKHGWPAVFEPSETWPRVHFLDCSGWRRRFVSTDIVERTIDLMTHRFRISLAQVISFNGGEYSVMPTMNTTKDIATSAMIYAELSD